MILAILSWISLSTLLAAAEARIVKVLPQWMDARGRTSLAPSLFERDAYQDHLRNHPEEVAGIRFQVLARLPRTRESCDLVVRIRTASNPNGEPIERVVPVKRRLWGKAWTEATLDGEAFRNAGKVLAWEVRLVDPTGNVVASQKSFLW